MFCFKTSMTISGLQRYKENLTVAGHLASPHAGIPMPEGDPLLRLRTLVHSGIWPQWADDIEIPGAYRERMFFVAEGKNQFEILVRISGSTGLVEKYMSSPNKPRFRDFESLCALYPSIDPAFLVGLERFPQLRDPRSVKIGNYLRIRKMLAGDRQNVPIANRLAFKTFLLFGTPQDALRYYQKCLEREGLDANKKLSALVSRIRFPSVLDGVDFRQWGRAFNRYAFDEIHPLFTRGAPYFSPRGEAGSVVTLNTIRLRTAFVEAEGSKDPGVREVISLCKIFNLSLKKSLKALEIFAQKSFAPPPPEFELPEITIAGEEFGFPGTTFLKIPDGDPRILFMGRFTECCEWFGSSYASFNSTSKHALTTNQSGFYCVVDNATQTPLVHSWAWRGIEGSLNFDGFESRGKETGSFQQTHLTALLRRVEALVYDVPMRVPVQGPIGVVFNGTPFVEKMSSLLKVSRSDRAPAGIAKMGKILSHSTFPALTPAP